ncbi:MAG: serine hydrolase [Pseudomonadota bacterium]
MRIEIFAPLHVKALLLGILFFLYTCSPEHKATSLSSALPAKTCSPRTEKTTDPGNTAALPGSALERASSELLYDLLKAKPDMFSSVLEHAQTYELQILFTQIERTSPNVPSFKHYAYRVNARKYFNPASLVKLPVICLALQKLNSLHIKGLDKNTPLSIGRQHSCQTAVKQDASAPGGRPTIAHYIKKILLVSDNDAYNRLYEFLGQEYINKTLWSLGYEDVRIIRRFSDCDADENRHTNSFTFFARDNEILYTQPMLINQQIFKNPLPDVKKGTAYIDRQGRYVHKPYDYTFSNNLSLQDIHTMLIGLIFPQAFPEHKRFLLSDADYRFLYEYLSMLPGESDIPLYSDSLLHPDNYKKYFIFGDAPQTKMRNSSIRIFNVVGRSDGYLSDCAYIFDPVNKIEFFLSAVIYVHDDKVMRDGKYGYDAIGLPFLSELGRTMYAYEKARKMH